MLDTQGNGIGPAPIAMTKFNADFHNDPSCVTSNSCIIGNDAIGGDPMDNDLFPGSVNIDIASKHLLPPVPPPVPVPGAVWLLGSGCWAWLVPVGAENRKLSEALVRSKVPRGSIL